jgi:hypothetical protein
MLGHEGTQDKAGVLNLTDGIYCYCNDTLPKPSRLLQ